MMLQSYHLLLYSNLKLNTEYKMVPHTALKLSIITDFHLQKIKKLFVEEFGVRNLAEEMAWSRRGHHSTLHCTFHSTYKLT